MEIQRDNYLNQLISYQWDGMVKVITGIRRCGKSYLLKNIFRRYLLSEGTKDENIIIIELDLAKDIRYRNPLELTKYVRSRVEGDNDKFYLFVDEIQMSDPVLNPYNPDGAKITFYDALNDLRSLDNLDIYVTGSNSRMLASDILTEFRGRSDNIHVHPLSFSEYYSALRGDRNEAFDSYSYYGGMPFLLSRVQDFDKKDYLKDLFSEVYIRDIVERKRVEYKEILEAIIDLLCSSIGSLTNPTRIANALSSQMRTRVSINTVSKYIDYLKDSFLFSESKRFDIKGKEYISSPSKYYSEDVGLRNARLDFRQQEPTHIMENMIYNELVYRRFSVDVGLVYAKRINENGNSVRVPKEVDFIASAYGKKVYIQSAFAMENEEKRESELKPFSLIRDSFQKIVVRRDIGKRWYDDKGILHINIIDFLLDRNVI